MGVGSTVLDSDQVEFIKCAPVYFVASAPIGPEGHINCSPRPGDWSLFVDSPTSIGWFDLVGSGNETISHLKDNGRIVLMFCSFGKVPSILRIHGQGTVHEPGSQYFEDKIKLLERTLGIRAVVAIDIDRISTSCGFGVPIMDFVGQRESMDNWLARKGEIGLIDYRKQNNLTSIDGLLGLDESRIV